MSRWLTATNWSERSRSASSSARSRSSMARRCFIRATPPCSRSFDSCARLLFGGCVGRPPELDTVGDVVDFGEAHPHVFADACRQVLADEVGTDRQLTVAAVDEHRELDRTRTTELDERVHR